MPDVLLARRPLGGREDEPLRVHGNFATVRLDEKPLQAAFELQFDAGDRAMEEALTHASGIQLTAINRVVANGATSAFWLGPGHSLIMIADPTSMQTFERAVAVTGSSLIDVSDLWFTVSIAGKRSPDVLAKACAVDLDPLVFAPGAMAVTQFVRMRALIHHVDAAPTYYVYTERSFAVYVWAWLVDAITEFLD